jgi:type I restriction enzyme, S subunit
MSFEDWKVEKLKHLTLKIGSGATPKGGKESYKESGISFIRSQNVLNHTFAKEGLVYIDKDQANKLNNVIVEEEDVLLNITGDSVCRCCIVPSEILPARVNQHVCIIRCDPKKILPHYLKSYLNSPYMQSYMLSLAYSGGTRAALTKGMIENFDIPVPSIGEQSKIVSLLSSIDKKIELNNQINKNLEEMAQAIFKRWFVDFEFPNENGEPYKSSGGEFEESELGLIPKGWFVTEMGSFLMPKNERVNDKNLILYSTTNQGLQLRDEKFKKNLTKNNKKNKIIEKNDIVFGMSREILNFGVMKDKIGAVSPAYHVFKVDSDIYNAELLEMYMRIRSDYFLDLIKPGAREGQVIDRAHLQKKRLIVPKKEIQDHFYEVFSCIKNTMQTIEDQTNILIQIRDTLLPKLMSGEIRVPLENEGRHQDEQLQRV